MNILYLCQVFEVGRDPGSERHFYFCKHAVRKGHRVSAVTSNVDYRNARVKYMGQTDPVKQTLDGVDVYYVYSYANFRGSYLKRVYYYLTYFYSSIRKSLGLEKPDIIYAVSTPLTVGLLACIIARLRGVPFIFEVTDVWPDAAVACGVLKNKILIRIARWLESFCYKKASHIVGLSQGLCENIIAKGVARGKVSLITNGVDLSLFSSAGGDSKRLELRTRHGLGDRFVAMYLGAHGAYNSLDTILETAKALKDDPRFIFILVGDGDEKAKLQQQVAAYRLENVLFLPPIPRVDSPAMLAVADAFLLPNRTGTFFKGNLPNKLFDFLISARPIIVTGEGETCDLVQAAGCGVTAPPGDSKAMAAALRSLAAMPIQERVAMGERGRTYVTKHYDREMLSDHFLEILACFCGKGMH